ncbi:hypothetical protein QCA50_013857 [Cerrena zonata]|uniref:Uncharacterized protein n=1 Tax=Cerrena zonata TaxID=2478898 RepID=A0AAW0FYC1_9APHY
MTPITVPPTLALLNESDLARLPELIQSAVDRQESSYSLQSLNDAILNYYSTDDDLDPLAIFPLLLPSAIDDTDILLKTAGVKCSPREALIALQEGAERLASTDQDEDSDKDSDDVPASTQAARILTLYSIVLPRLNKRKKTASEILRPLMSQLQGTIRTVSQHENTDPQELLRSLLLLTHALPDWIGDDSLERSAVANLLYNVLQEILQCNANNIHSGLTPKAFERQYPNLRVPGASPSGPSGNPVSQTMADTLNALAGLGFETNILTTQPSIASLILIAHSPQPRLVETTLEAFLPVILASIQSNTALDETLAVLLDTLGHLRNTVSRPDLAIDILIPLAHVLAPLASIHPDPPTRHATFRVLSIVLTLSPSLIRMKLLRDLVIDEDESMQQMRVAAVGLVKEAVLEALNAPRTTSGPPNVFISPLLMQEIGSVLFLKQAENIAPTVVKFLESAEPLRLIESMGLLYVLLLRDVDNRTGVRDHSFIQEVERTMLAPLKTRLALWEKDTGNLPELDHATMQIGILDMWLGRIASAIDNISR